VLQNELAHWWRVKKYTDWRLPLPVPPLVEEASLDVSHARQQALDNHGSSYRS
jgi:hypothetical protein